MGLARKGAEIRYPTSSRPREARSAQVSVRRAVEKNNNKRGRLHETTLQMIADRNVNTLPLMITQSAEMLVIDRVITYLVKFGYRFISVWEFHIARRSDRPQMKSKTEDVPYSQTVTNSLMLL